MLRMASGILALGAVAALASAQSVTPALRSELAPNNSLRVAINYNNPLVARRDATTGELSGTAVDLARELARRAGVTLEMIPYDSAARVTAAAASGAWDLAFLAIDPARATEVDFTAPYIEIEGTYLVPANSPLRRIEDVDRDGVRIAVTTNSAYDLFLSRELTRAQLVRAATTPDSITLMTTRKVDVLAGVRTALVAAAPQMPGARVLPGHFMTIAHAVAIPRGRPADAQFVSTFIEDAKASGLVARALARHGWTSADAIVAPPSKRR